MLFSRVPTPFIYNDIRFRSRLEAQWACYLDGLGIGYLYEAKTFRLDCELKGATQYTPDFYLPSLDVYLEVKPENENIRTSEGYKADALAEHLKTGRVWLSHGTAPWFEQLPSPRVPAIPKALLTHDAARTHDPSAFWIIDARYITLNKSLETTEGLTSPERLPALTSNQQAPAHPLASPLLRTAVEMARDLKISDRFEIKPSRGKRRSLHDNHSHNTRQALQELA